MSALHRTIGILSFIPLMLALFSIRATAETTPLEQRALSLQLWRDPSWRALLHLTSAPDEAQDRSLVQSPEFFLSAPSPLTARDELLVTLKTLLTSDEQGDMHPKCRYPARTAFLQAHLPELAQLLPDVRCPEFEQWSKAIDAARITLVFPSYFVNNPASAFGHTLIRFDQAQRGDNERLLSYAANFAAHADPQDNALVYAAKGLFGGYNGYFSVEPYYNKVTQYNDLEDRDIWEYELNFSLQEVQTIVQHLWELRRVAFSYYYFDENCSFALLSLLQVARPALSLTTKFPTWALPVDTVRALVEEDGLVGAVRFRPSKALTLRHLDRTAAPIIRATAAQIARGERTIADQDLVSLAPSEQALTLDIAYEYVNYRILSTTDRSEELRKRAHALLLARSSLEAPAPPPPPTPTTRPEQGHRTLRLSLGSGFADDTLFGTFGVRAVYHELIDPPAGYLPGGEMVLGGLETRWNEADGVEVEEIQALRATSLTPRDEFIRPLSWRLEVGAHRRTGEGSRPLVGRLWGGAGLTYDINGSLLYGLITTGMEGADYFDSTATAGAGFETGVIHNLTQQWGVSARSWIERYSLGDNFTSYGIEGSLRLQIERDLNLRFVTIQERDIGGVLNSSAVYFDLFF